MFTPEMHAFLIAEPALDLEEFRQFAKSQGASAWGAKTLNAAKNPAAHGEILAETAGRLCYKSFEVGLNPNVIRVREDRTQYLRNILASGHGSVLEHINYSFVLTGISRTVTHELVRHRAGCAYSQESLRYVRLTDLPFRLPESITDSPALRDAALAHLKATEDLLAQISETYDLDNSTDFHQKKTVTNDMRYLAPMGVLTQLMMTANVRALRHMITLRTSEGAQEEIRELFGKVARLMIQRSPALFGDFTETEVEGRFPAYVPTYTKV